MITSRPSTKPISFKPARKAATRGAIDSGEVSLRNPICRAAGDCAVLAAEQREVKPPQTALGTEDVAFFQPRNNSQRPTRGLEQE